MAPTTRATVEDALDRFFEAVHAFRRNQRTKETRAKTTTEAFAFFTARLSDASTSWKLVCTAAEPMRLLKCGKSDYYVDYPEVGVTHYLGGNVSMKAYGILYVDDFTPCMLIAGEYVYIHIVFDNASWKTGMDLMDHGITEPGKQGYLPRRSTGIVSAEYMAELEIAKNALPVCFYDCVNHFDDFDE